MQRTGERYCRCPGEHCFDSAVQCAECDDRGLPRNAKRRLTNPDADGYVRDRDNGQLFKCRKTKNGVRAIPQFKDRVDWKGKQGFQALCLILSCLGSEGEYVLWDQTADAPMELLEWKKKEYTSKSRPPIRHRECKQTVTTTSIDSLNGKAKHPGCTCHSNLANHWRNRRPEIVVKGKAGRFQVITSEDEWVEQCDGVKYCPKLRCLECDEVITSTSVGVLHQGQGIGCKCHSTRKKHWRNRHAEIVIKGESNFFEVLTPEVEWLEKCDGAKYCPRLRCLKCNETFTTTCVLSLHLGHIGCSCHSTRKNHWRNRRSEIVAKGKACRYEVLTSEAEWLIRCHGAKFCPKLRCLECCEVVTTSLVNNLNNLHSIGCTCHSGRANHWRHRRAEIVAKGETGRYEVLTPEDEWVDTCDGARYHPKLRCLQCGEVVTTSSLCSLQKGDIGCTCHSNHAKHWRYRRPEVVAMGVVRSFEVLTTEDEWVNQCNGCRYYPRLRCLECREVVTSTSVLCLQQGGGVGCTCRNKTERKLCEWLRQRFPEATVTPQSPGPGRMHFDFRVAFADGIEVFVELDGPQHFWKDQPYYTTEGCKRDLQKEEWAMARGLCVLRVLQENVWNDRYDWQGWLTRSFEDARSGELHPITPEAREYRSEESTYVQLRA